MYFENILLVATLIFLFIAGKEINAETEYEYAVLAGGCFWCMEAPFEKLDGVESVISGYTGGQKENPTYEEVSSGTTGHVEAIQIKFDPMKVSYRQILDVFWLQIDPTDDGGQFVDRGQQYITGIFYTNEKQKNIAKKSKENLDKSGRFKKPVITEITKFEKFYKAEDYHQNYYKTNPLRYKSYKYNSGRDQFIKKVWINEELFNKTITKYDNYKKPSEPELKKTLDSLTCDVTQQEGTERAFTGKYWDNKKEGIYVDILSGEPLFSSKDKFDSGTGWPSFTQPIDKRFIVEKEDRKLWSVRTEVRSKFGDNHLGHVFDDGPEPTGLRYCLNSVALKFIPKEDMKKEGYEDYLYIFE